MSHQFGPLRVAGICLHVLTVAVVLVNYQRAMLIFCLVVAGLIAPGSRAAVPGRPLTLYIAFGLLMGYVFWMGVSALNQQYWFLLILVLITAIGAAWVLQHPGVPSLIYTEIAILVSIAIAIQLFRAKPDFSDPVPDRERQTGITMMIMLVIGMLYTALGVTEALEGQSRPTRSKKPRARRVRT